MQSQFKQRHEGLRWNLTIPTLDGLRGKAALEVQKSVQQFLPYVLPVSFSDDASLNSPGHLAVVGDVSQPLISRLIESDVIQKPEGAEGYSVFLGQAPWDSQSKLLVVAGHDEAGTLYGSQEAASRLSLEGHLLDGFAARRNHIENGAAFSVAEKPVISRRGIWSWGYAIYSSRAFIDNMAKLKLNTLVIWNDHAPLNIRDVIDYAHTKGISVVLGFHCGWGHKSLDISNAQDRSVIVQNVLKTYQEQYAHLPHDGIYFQTLTEHSERALSGASTASWVCHLANETAEALLEKYPELRMEFGIHGTSIGEDDKDLQSVHPGVELVWEDCGSVPFAYFAHQTENFQETVAWSKRLANLRPGNEFAMVAKGWMQLRWDRDFENHGSFILGEQSADWIHKRLTAREAEWSKINHYWYRSYPLAAAFYRELLQINPRMTVTGLVEDGLLEEKIQPSVALFAETLWNPYLSDTELLARATRSF